MRVLKLFFDFYIKASLHVGCAVFCFVLLTDIGASLKPNLQYVYCVFLGTIAGYNFLKYYAIITIKKHLTAKYLGIVFLSLLSLLGFFYFFCQIGNNLKIQLLLAFVFVIIYPLIRINGGLKFFWVSFVLAYITVLIPMFTSHCSIFWIICEFTKRILVISALLIPFEILDSKKDPISMNTVPQRFGISGAKLFGYFFIFLFLFFQSTPIDCIIAVITLVFIYFSSSKRNQYYTLFWVESVPIFWLLLVLIFR